MRQAGLLLQIGFTCFLTIKKPRLFSGAAKVWKNVDPGKGACQLLAIGYSMSLEIRSKIQLHRGHKEAQRGTE
jgi:hypothetical protein